MTSYLIYAILKSLFILKGSKVNLMIQSPLTKRRFSNIELLRIVAMFLIVMHHFSVHGSDRNVLPYGVDLLFVDFFQ